MSDDLISRDAVLDACSQSINILDAMSRIEDLSSVKPKPCEDAISRQAVLDMMQMRMSGKELYKAVYELPPVTPKQRTGHWILRDDINGQYQCDECGMFSGLSKFDVEEEGWELSNFCSNCEAKMEEQE